ncbi:MAG: ribbon-helix-helix domain-containing protein [Chloroflexi bacterium]|nr:ribbon-helix-helix domain-containing protein [Chloroflexota bacterium]
MSKVVTVRLEDYDLQRVEAVRDPARYPTQSDFIREAIRTLVREERRRAAAREVRELARDDASMSYLADLANARVTGVETQTDEESEA